MKKINVKNKILKVDKKLPKIILPNNKIDMFVDWWNKDIRFQTEVPHSFNEGYLILQNNFCDIDISKFSNIIKLIAHEYKMTYRLVESKFLDFIKLTSDITIYFFFIDNNLYLHIYGVDNSIISGVGIEFGEDKNNINYEPEMSSRIEDFHNYDDFMNAFNRFCVNILITSLWYIATTTNTKKYRYENKVPNDTIQKDKNIVRVASKKVMSTPIYDISKIRVVKVDTLVARRKGWTYSHSFQVHGHYRHYKNGKTVFIQPYIKGKGKEFQQQTITLNPVNF